MNDHGDTVLHSAFSPAMAHLVLDYGAHIDARDAFGSTMLHRIAPTPDLLLAQALLDREANVNATDGQGRSPLELAAGFQFDQPRMIRLLVRYGAKPIGLGLKAPHRAVIQCDLPGTHSPRFGSEGLDALDDFHNRPLHWAATLGREGWARYLLAEGGDVGARNERGFTPLHLAAVVGNIGIARVLINHGAKPKALDRAGNAAVDVAALNDHHELVDLLKPLSIPDAGFFNDVSSRDEKAMTPLHHAVRTNNLQLAAQLIGAGADVNATDQNTWTPLFFAVNEGHPEVVRLLLQHGAHPDAMDRENCRPLFYVTPQEQRGGYSGLKVPCMYDGGGHSEAARLLYEYGASGYIYVQY